MNLSRLLPLAALAALALSPAPAQAQARSGALPISLPPNAVVQIEVDGRDNDMLGMIKDLIGGVHFGPDADAQTGTEPAGTAVTVSKPGGPPTLLSDGQMTALLKNIHHLHLVSFEPPVASGKSTAAAFDGLAFYDKPFQSQGGHRILFYGNGPRVALYGFDQTRSFALRADGYPDMAVIGKILHFNLGNGVPATATPAPADAAPPAAKP